MNFAKKILQFEMSLMYADECVDGNEKKIYLISVPCNGPWYTNYKTNYLHQCIVLKSFTIWNLLHILKLILKLLQHVSVPLDHRQGARRSYPKVTTDHLLVRYTVVLQYQA